MAEVRLRFGRGPYNFARKICNRYLLKSPNKEGKSAIQASSLPAGFLLGDNNPERQQRGAVNAADGVTDGASPDSYTRVTPLFGNVSDVWVNAPCCFGLNNEYSFDKKSQVQNTEKILPRYRKFRRTFRQRSPGVCLGNGQFVFIRAYSGNGARSEPLYKTKTGYYDILEVSPTVTQAQIKTAYYKQSFIYHPDRNAASEDATVRFSEISEAYTVLGNKALRKKYDRGLLSHWDLIGTARPSSSSKDTGGSAKQPAEKRRSVVGVDGRGGVFDFDNFIKAHYSEQLQRQRDIRVRKEEMLKKKQATIDEKKIGGMLEMGIAVLTAMAVGLMFSLMRG